MTEVEHMHDMYVYLRQPTHITCMTWTQHDSFFPLFVKYPDGFDELSFLL